MKKLLLSISFALCTLSTTFAATGDTTIIVAHAATNLGGYGNYDSWITFPDSGKTYQKIIMRFTLGAGLPQCSHWDYTVNTLLGKKNGTIDSAITAIDTLTLDTTWAYSEHVDFTEIGRLITPYGNYMDYTWTGPRHGFDSSWTHPYVYDITDYASYLKDSVNVRVHYDGWSAAFRAKVEFIFIEGQPTRTVENVREVYHAYYSYPNSTDFENQVSAQTFSIAPNVTSAKVAVYITGHQNQGEFDPHSFYLKVNGAEVYTKLFWKDDCDINPVSPQGGTWILHRANWCPGDKVPVYEADITPYITAGQNASIDLDLDDFSIWPPDINTTYSAGYGITAHLITYSSQKNNDAMMEEIIAPNSDKPYLHWNPVCTNAKVKIKNTGKQNLTYAEISYWVKGGNKWYYEWTGNLDPFQSEIITLPAFDFSGLDTNDRVFYAEVKWPNQTPDEFTFNNKLESAFKMTPKLDSIFIIYFKSNNRPQEDAYLLRNENGDTVLFKNTFAASTLYRDTMHLTPGSYYFDFYDYDATNYGCGDGLQIWMNQPPTVLTTAVNYESTGLLRFYKKNGTTMIKNWDGDFGGNSHYEFTVGYPLGHNSPKTPPSAPVHNTGINDLAVAASLNIFPNPAKDLVNIQINMSQDADGTIEMNDISGRTIRQFTVKGSSTYYMSIPTSDFSKGMYFVNFISEGIRVCQKLVIQ